MKATLKHPLISLKIHGIFFKPQVASLELEQVTFQAPKRPPRRPSDFPGAQVTSQAPQVDSWAPKVTSQAPQKTSQAPQMASQVPQVTSQAPQETSPAP